MSARVFMRRKSYVRWAGAIGLVALVWAALSCAAAASGEPASATLRCGWFDNPTPSNAWLYDRDGEWTIAVQGGHQAEGNWPNFKKSQWVHTGAGSYGYGCACLRLEVDAETHNVKRIVAASARPLTLCRKDAALKGKEPENPLR